MFLTFPKCCPRNIILIFENRKKSQMAQIRGMGRIFKQWLNYGLGIHVQLMLCAMAHCHDAKSIRFLPTTVVAHVIHDLEGVSRYSRSKLHLRTVLLGRIHDTQFHECRKKEWLLFWFWICFFEIFWFTVLLSSSTLCSATSMSNRIRKPMTHHP